MAAPINYADKNHEQLCLPFNEVSAIMPIDISTNFDNLQKLFIPIEFAKYPFFLNRYSKKVVRSREGYKALQKLEELKNSNLSEEELIEQTSYTTSPALRRKNQSETYSASLNNELVNVVDNWQIIAHEDYGFPDEFDGEVFEYIQKLISRINQNTNLFYQLYIFSEGDIIKYLISKGIINYAHGKYYKMIRDSILRLRNTTFYCEKGFYRKDTNEIIDSSQYQFSLFSSVYFKGDRLPDGSISNQIAVAIDPIMLLNFRNNHFLIAYNPLRQKLVEFSSKSIFDKLTWLTYNSLQGEDFFIAMKYNVRPFIFMSYTNLCDFLGFEPRKGNDFKPVHVSRQFKAIFSDLFFNQIVDNILIDAFKTESKEKVFRFIFLINKNFINDVLSLGNQELKSKVDYNYSITRCQLYFNKVTGIIRNDKICKYLKSHCTGDKLNDLPSSKDFPFFVDEQLVRKFYEKENIENNLDVAIKNEVEQVV